MAGFSTPDLKGDGGSVRVFSSLNLPGIAGVTARVSIGSDGTQANNTSDSPAISADGRYIAFASLANNLAGDADTNVCYPYSAACPDVFVHDRQTGQTVRVSVASDGSQANDYSIAPAVSADGRYVVFESRASNLVSGDTNDVCDTDYGAHSANCPDVFIHDLLAGQTTRVSIGANGEGNGKSGSPSISADGRYVAFQSEADNLVAADTNGYFDIFVRDGQSGQTSRASLASDGMQANGRSWGPAISTDGRYVAFWSDASNLVFDDTNDVWDIFVHDRQTGQTERVSVASDGTQGNDAAWYLALSADGRYVAFHSYANNLVSNDTNYQGDIFVRDRQLGKTSRVSLASDGTQANNWSIRPSISASGRYVTFHSWADNLVGDDTNGLWDVFVHDRQTGQTERVSLASNGVQAAGGMSTQSSISADGRYVAFQSDANNLVVSDTNHVTDIFVHERGDKLFSISGQVMDSNGNPIPGIVLSAGEAVSVTTDASGYYTFTDLVAGTYTLTPTTPGYFWSPANLVVSVPPSAAGQNFVAYAIQKQVFPRHSSILNFDDILTYTIHIVMPASQQLLFYDRVPSYTQYISNSLDAPAGVGYNLSAQAISGTLDLIAAVPITLSFAARVNVSGTVDFAPVITNSACIYLPGQSLADCLWSNDVWSFTFAWQSYLPVVLSSRSAYQDSKE